jgi:hypothetical protein
MQDSKWVLRIAGAIILAAVAMLSGCSSGGTNRQIAVVDRDNNRVLLFTNDSDTSASAVLGQGNFTSGSANQGGAVGANTLSSPSAAQSASSGNIVVLDLGNCRALIFKPPFGNNMNASAVLGEPDFATTNCVNGLSATSSSLFNPSGAAFDSKGNLWIADFGDSRVLEYVPPFTNGMAASQVLGQASLTASAGCNRAGLPSGATLCLPAQLTFDSAGNLWIADYGNSRVVMYSPANQTTGGAATVVLGQTDLVSNIANFGGLSASTLNGPVKPAFDSSGNLWVSDSGNNRVLMYPVASLTTNGASATVVLGQTDFISNIPNQGGGPAAGTLSQPEGMAFVYQGRLAVADLANHRVLTYFPPFTNGMDAANVTGQLDFTHNSANQGGAIGAGTLNSPMDVMKVLGKSANFSSATP